MYTHLREPGVRLTRSHLPFGGLSQGRHCPLVDDKSYRPLLTASSANQSECNIEQEDSIVYKMELTIEMGSAIVVYHAVC